MTPIRTTELIAVVSEETSVELTLEQAERIWDRLAEAIKTEKREYVSEALVRWQDDVNRNGGWQPYVDDP